MTNFRLSGCVIPLTAPYTVVSGAGALVGKIFGVAQSDVTSGAVGEFCIDGVSILAKDTSTFTEGDPVYWDNSAKKCTSTAQSNWLIGVFCPYDGEGTASVGALTGATTMKVRLNGTAARAFFKSTEATGTGSAQNIAHGLGVAPSLVIIFPSDASVATAGVYVVTEGSHTSTNVVVTVTSGKKFFAVAYA
jgi:predicted RecA/RadA family phage recombinase